MSSLAKYIKMANREPVSRTNSYAKNEVGVVAPGGPSISDAGGALVERGSNFKPRRHDQKPLPNKLPMPMKAAPGVKTEQPQ